MAKFPFIAARSYAAIVLLLFIFALVTHDDFGFRFIPVLYATRPVSWFLYPKATYNFFVATGVGAATNVVVLYAVLQAVAYATASRRAK